MTEVCQWVVLTGQFHQMLDVLPHLVGTIVSYLFFNKERSNCFPISEMPKQEPNITLEELQQFSNSEPDPTEESRLDQVILIKYI